MSALAQARRDAVEARECLRASAQELRRRGAPHELAEDAVHLFDPDLKRLAAFRARILENRLLSIALISGLAWLAAPRRAHGAATAPTTKKEKTHDSGQRQHQQHRRTGKPVPVQEARSREPFAHGEESLAAQERRTRGFGKKGPQLNGGGR